MSDLAEQSTHVVTPQQYPIHHPTLLPPDENYDALYTAVQNESILSQAHTALHNTELSARFEQQLSRRKAYAVHGAMNVARSALSQLLTICLSLWMTGNSLQIFTLIMLVMTLQAPFKALIQIDNTFARYQITPDVSLRKPKFFYTVIQVMSLIACFYKCYKMNLIPVEYLYGISQSSYVHYVNPNHNAFCVPID